MSVGTWNVEGKEKRGPSGAELERECVWLTRGRERALGPGAGLHTLRPPPARPPSCSIRIDLPPSLVTPSPRGRWRMRCAHLGLLDWRCLQSRRVQQVSLPCDARRLLDYLLLGDKRKQGPRLAFMKGRGRSKSVSTKLKMARGKMKGRVYHLSPGHEQREGNN